MKSILYILSCLLTTTILAQDASKVFPEAYFGSYKGDLVIQNANGTQTIGMEFHMKPTDSVGNFTYQLVYISNGKRQERNYNLIAKSTGNGEYIVDENNGILLSAKNFDNRLYSMFEVQGNLLVTIEEFYDDYMIFQIIFSDSTQKTESKAMGEATIDVFSYPVTVSQRAKLIKQ